MLRAMRGSTLERRAFVTLMGQALVGAGVLAISRPDPVPARDRDPNVFAGQETFEQLLALGRERAWRELPIGERIGAIGIDRKSTRLNSSHGYISYAVFCLKKKKRTPGGTAAPPPSA